MATFTELKKQLTQLEAELQRTKHKEQAGVIKRIKPALVLYGITAADLGFTALNAPLNGAAGKAKVAPASKALTPKEAIEQRKTLPLSEKILATRAIQPEPGATYRSPNGVVWEGNGSKPFWLQKQLKMGRQLDDFKVREDGTTAHGGRRATADGKSVLYRSPRGKEWDGTGSKPEWLKKQEQDYGRKPEDFLVREDGTTAHKDQSGAHLHPPKPAAKAARKIKATKKPHTGLVKGAKRRIKFRDDAGNTWSGAGHKPKWLVAHLAAGKTLDEFRVPVPEPTKK